MMIVVDVGGTPHSCDDPHPPPVPSSEIAARALSNDRWQVLAETDGTLFNPVEHPTIPQTRDRERGEPLYKLRRCGKRVFDRYTEYLRTKNRVHLVIAQREFLDD